MAAEQLTKRRDREIIKHDTAKQIRELLDEARQEYGATEWDADGLESAVLELVTEDA